MAILQFTYYINAINKFHYPKNYYTSSHILLIHMGFKVHYCMMDIDEHLLGYFRNKIYFVKSYMWQRIMMFEDFNYRPY